MFDEYEGFDAVKVFSLLAEMEKCVDRVKALRIKFESGCYDQPEISE